MCQHHDLSSITGYVSGTVCHEQSHPTRRQLRIESSASEWRLSLLHSPTLRVQVAAGVVCKWTSVRSLMFLGQIWSIISMTKKCLKKVHIKNHTIKKCCIKKQNETMSHYVNLSIPSSSNVDPRQAQWVKPDDVEPSPPWPSTNDTLHHFPCHKWQIPGTAGM